MVEKDDETQRHRKESPDLSSTEARQSERGRPILYLLIAGLVLALLTWTATEMFTPEAATTGDGTPVEEADGG
ncbi:hypothetical protein [Martelella mediterranea]|uniref:Uncharacterized protein n=1 Tax=Martelella mediterranea TaxID=293089 RepID=A0A4R3NV26_9HYPH|nr:hypothetical protein [Martelella mediterranea]TCT40222.1 hypothetical protein EDC90_101074 [Martelella mediterranea]